MHVALPKLVKMDAALIPDTLQFGVPAVPPAMVKKAAWYASNKETHVHIVKQSEDVCIFYMLSQSSEAYKRINALLVSRYAALCAGGKPRGLTKLESFIDVLHALHVVSFGEDVHREAPSSKMNHLRKQQEGHGERRTSHQ